MSISLDEAIRKGIMAKLIDFILEVAHTLLDGDEDVSSASRQVQSVDINVLDWVEDYYNNLDEAGKAKHGALTPFMRNTSAKAFQNILENALSSSCPTSDCSVI